MSITDELREVARTHTTPELYTVVEADTLFDIANRIDEEHKRALTEQLDMFTVDMKPMTDENMAESGWVRLPVDADGEVIHIGDEMVGVDKYDPCKSVKGKVIAVNFESDGTVNVAVRVWSSDGKCKSWHRAYLDQGASDYHHYHEPTVEDVLREFQDEVQGCCDTEDTIAEFADRIREVLCDAQ